MPLPPVGIDASADGAATAGRTSPTPPSGGCRAGCGTCRPRTPSPACSPSQLPEPQPIYQPPRAGVRAAARLPHPPRLPRPHHRARWTRSRAGIGSTLSGIGGRARSALSGARGALTGGVQAAQQTAGSWADQADAAIDGLGDTFGDMGQQLAGGFTQAPRPRPCPRSRRRRRTSRRRPWSKPGRSPAGCPAPRRSPSGTWPPPWPTCRTASAGSWRSSGRRRDAWANANGPATPGDPRPVPGRTGALGRAPRGADATPCASPGRPGRASEASAGANGPPSPA